jgi:hypothetical protein
VKFYASFGQVHTHRIGGNTYDCDSLMLVEAPDEITARRGIYQATGGKWCGTYHESQLPEIMRSFHRGVINHDTPLFAEDWIPKDTEAANED